MKRPPVWTEEQLEEHRLIATERFRRARMEEPLEQYVASFDESQGAVEELLEYTLDLTDLQSNIVEVLTDSKLLEAFRSMAGPPVSEDDLKVVAEATLSKKRLLSDPEVVSRIRGVILSGLDRRRFPWVIEGRDPTESERHAAIIASAALLATRQSQTQRRSDGKREQEAAVHKILLANGFVQVPTRHVGVLNDAPGPGEFCGESELGTRKADVLIGLPDRRVMPLECKVSNSSTNSVKRLNNDAAVKAVTWKKDFGEIQVVPAAVLGGVYKLRNLQSAQERGLTLFWEHKLHDLIDWIGL
ncbi:TPA: XamI family restriction endonuclease [Stenotrophomonas maltophilia]